MKKPNIFNFLKFSFAAIFVLLSLTSCSDSGIEPMIDKVLAGEHRKPSNVNRDEFRHPKETLLFFGISPEQSVVEITPGFGWYAEILAPLLHDKGQYYYTSYNLHKDINPFFIKMEKKFKEKMKLNPNIYKKLRWVHFKSNQPDFAPDGPVDMVLTFRNVHNWAKAGTAESMFAGFNKALKPGGVLGLIEHRAKPATPIDQQIKSGYMTVEYVVKLAEKNGFRLEASSEINANPNDSSDHPGGVWNLLPNLRDITDENKEVMLQIGESDRMTLKFIKE